MEVLPCPRTGRKVEHHDARGAAPRLNVDHTHIVKFMDHF
jgi:hypothetical protein